MPNYDVDYSYGGANMVAEIQQQWQSCFKCGQPYGFCTAIAGGSPYDQFAAYRNVTITASLSAFLDFSHVQSIKPILPLDLKIMWEKVVVHIFHSREIVFNPIFARVFFAQNASFTGLMMA